MKRWTITYDDQSTTVALAEKDIWTGLPNVESVQDAGEEQIETPTPVKAWNELDFRREFTRTERKAIVAAAASSADVDDFVKLLEAAGRSGSRILATDQDVIDGLNALEAGGIIGDGRAAEILGT